MNLQKLALVSTIVLAVTALITTGLAAYGISQTRGAVSSAEATVNITREMLEINRQTAELNNKTLQAELLKLRYERLHASFTEQRLNYHVHFQEYIYRLAGNEPGAACGLDLVNYESLCHTLGEDEWYCWKFHEYDRAYERAKLINWRIPRSMQEMDFNTVVEQLDLLEDALEEMAGIYREVFLPGKVKS